MDTHAYRVEHRDGYGKLVDAWEGVCSHGDAMQRAARMISAMFIGDVVSIELRESEGKWRSHGCLGRALVGVVVG